MRSVGQSFAYVLFSSTYRVRNAYNLEEANSNTGVQGRTIRGLMLLTLVILFEHEVSHVLFHQELHFLVEVILILEGRSHFGVLIDELLLLELGNTVDGTVLVWSV